MEIQISMTGHATRVIESRPGRTLMEILVNHDVEGIEAQCGGACACATCHVYIDPQWRDMVGQPTPVEEDMLDALDTRRPESRLSCQIVVRQEMDGLRIDIPDSHAG